MTVNNTKRENQMINTTSDNAKFAQHVQALMTGMSGVDRANVIRVLAQMPVGERVEFAQHAQALMTVSMDGWDRIRIVSVLAGVPAANRAGFVQYALARMTEGMNCSKRVAVIDTLATQKLNSTVTTKSHLGM